MVKESEKSLSNMVTHSHWAVKRDAAARSTIQREEALKEYRDNASGGGGRGPSGFTTQGQ
jgi:hypothetical protein